MQRANNKKQLKAKPVQKAQKRALTTKKAVVKKSQTKVTRVQSPSILSQSTRTMVTTQSKVAMPTMSVPKMKQLSMPVMPKFQMKSAPLSMQKRNMSILTGTTIRQLIPCDPRFEDDEVISMFNPKTGLIEPVIVAVVEQSFEWLHSSPCDLHTFDVVPVVKDVVSPDHPVFESMDA